MRLTQRAIEPPPARAPTASREPQIRVTSRSNHELQAPWIVGEVNAAFALGAGGQILKLHLARFDRFCP
ncbi:MAG: hypothetical protein ACXW2L_17770, partial [Burkholderiales bacterium]